MTQFVLMVTGSHAFDWRWLKGDLIKLGKQASYLEELMIQIAKTMETPVSYQTLSKNYLNLTFPDKQVWTQKNFLQD